MWSHVHYSVVKQPIRCSAQATHASIATGGRVAHTLTLILRHDSAGEIGVVQIALAVGQNARPPA
jgi:hypothetical protein